MHWRDYMGSLAALTVTNEPRKRNYLSPTGLRRGAMVSLRKFDRVFGDCKFMSVRL
jgi:hypothetical protein